MKRTLAARAMLVVLLSLVLASCSQSAPAPTSTQTSPNISVAPTPTTAMKSTEPTKAVAAPTTPAKAVFPEKGKPISLIVPYPAGGGADVAGRILASGLEKELGTPVQVVNKGGAGSQIGITEAVKAKPDGYTIGYANWPTIITIYLDPDRQPAFGAKDVQPVAMHLSDPMALTVKGDSPYKTLRDLVDAAKAKPEAVKAGVGGLLGPEHFTFLLLDKQTGCKFSIVNFDGGAPAVTAMLGGHVDANSQGIGGVLGQIKSGQLRILATLEKQEKPILPDVKSMAELGYNGFYGLSRVVIVPTGTPSDVVGVLSNAVKKVLDNEEHNKKAIEMGQIPKYMGPAEFKKYWTDMEAQIKPLLEMGKQQSK